MRLTLKEADRMIRSAIQKAIARKQLEMAGIDLDEEINTALKYATTKSAPTKNTFTLEEIVKAAVVSVEKMAEMINQCGAKPKLNERDVDPQTKLTRELVEAFILRCDSPRLQTKLWQYIGCKGTTHQVSGFQEPG